MSTKEYLARLDYAQLVFARDEADRLIEAKDAESRTVIWVVSSGMANVSAFTEDRYHMAVERLIEEIRKQAELGPKSIEVAIDKHCVRESELADWLALDD